MDIVTLGAALNGSAEYVNSHFVGGTNIQIVDNPDGTQTINVSGEVSSEDTVARAEIAEMKDGTNIDSFGDVETALATKANTATTYTKTEVDTALDGKADTSDIPTVPITAIQKNGTGITPISGTVNITVPTSAADVSALPNTTKYAAALSLTINSSTFVMTGQLKDQNGDNLGTAQTIDLPLESVVVNGSYNSQTKKVVLTLQNGNTIEFSVADLVSGLQTELSASNKLNPAYIDYDSAHAAVTEAQRDQIETNKNNISLLTPTVKDSGNAFTVGTDYTLCDACTLTIPAPASGQGTRVANISASLTFNNSAPRGIILSTSNSATDYDSNIKLLAKIESTEYIRLSAQCTFFNYSNTTSNIYVWVKSSSSAINRVISSMQLMN